MAPGQSKVHTYTEDELDDNILDELEERAEVVLGVEPFPWQMKVAAAILKGKDVIVDVGTGCGKSACFLLPLLLHDTDIVLVVSPLSALMIDQVRDRSLVDIRRGAYTADFSRQSQLRSRQLLYARKH